MAAHSNGLMNLSVGCSLIVHGLMTANVSVVILNSWQSMIYPNPGLETSQVTYAVYRNNAAATESDVVIYLLCVGGNPLGHWETILS
ncbi:hypothetical protein QQP08_008623 [Theobroma cacao]|nr:hypothetical protein QQP08_008623 [Theobroma cacao]